MDTQLTSNFKRGAIRVSDAERDQAAPSSASTTRPAA